MIVDSSHSLLTQCTYTPLSKGGTDPEVWRSSSEVKLVNLVVVGKGEASTKVLSEKRLLGVLNVLQNGSIDTFLSVLSLFGGGGLLSRVSEELVLASLLGLGVLLEEFVFDLGSIDTLNVDLGASAQSVSLIDSLEGNSIDLVGASDEQKTGGELLEENNAAASEATSQEDEDGAWGNALSELGSLVLGALLVVFLIVLSGIPSELLHHFTYKNT